MSFYPMFLNIKGWGCLVVGGGAVGLSRARGFHEAGGRVVVVSPEFDSGFGALTGIERRHRSFEEADLDDIFIAVTATNDPATNESVAKSCKERGILVNVVDDPLLCDFVVPSLVQRGALRVAVSTGAASPAFAGRMRQRIDEWLPKDVEAYVDFLGKAREHVKMSVSDADARKKVATYLASAEGYSKFQKMDEMARNTWLRDLIRDAENG